MLGSKLFNFQMKNLLIISILHFGMCVLRLTLPITELWNKIPGNIQTCVSIVYFKAQISSGYKHLSSVINIRISLFKKNCYLLE